ncbi:MULTISPECIES: PepSY domain-containing protein [Phyllobacterium]|uniref:PepSY domain-containing protein n=1 Tax=Phyllobacterium TaxID=28100 RepID=UPI001CC02A7B|nr:PepSY domain-containing protein [Phyllobacterium calauticae]MBZ3695431.1 PepSY domain-containing protein [Phyllobacterium calauticae]
MKRFIIALGALSLLSTAYAQETPKASPDAMKPAIATPDSSNAAAPVPGKNSFTAGQAKERLEAKGYTDVTAFNKGDDGIWSASAMKDGKVVQVKLDYQGNITEASK